MQDSPSSFLDALEIGLTCPHKVEQMLQGRKSVKFLIVLVGIYCSSQVLLVWFGNFLVPFSTWTDPTVAAYLWETFLPGSVWFESTIALMGVLIYCFLGIIPGVVIAQKTPEHPFKKIIKSVWISISFRLSFFFAIAAIPSLILLVAPWSHDNLVSVIWGVGIFLGFASTWITTGHVAEQYGTSRRIGIIASVFMSIAVFFLIGLYYLQVS